MKRFDLIEHTADIGLTAYGKNLAEAFTNAAYGMFSIMTDLRKVRKIESRTIELQEKNPEEQLLLKQCNIQEFDGHKIKAVCLGEKADLSRHRMKLGVKAATYHMLKVDPEKNQVRVIFDV
jgi:SHS2 domain-containing protein